MTRIVTHSGHFHADDVLAVALIRQFVDVSSLVIRTRDQGIIETGDIVVDVGDVFDPTRNRFDHHQFRSEAERRRSRYMPAVPLSSAGMVLEWLVDMGRLDDVLGQRLYRLVVADIDTHDNGEAGPVRPGFPASGSLSAVVNRFNPEWDEEHKNYDRQFLKAVDFMVDCVLRPAVRAARAGIRAVDVVKAGMSLDGDRILVIAHGVPGIREIILDLEMPHLFVIHPSGSEGWQILCTAPSREDIYSQKHPLPRDWAGMRGEALNTLMIQAGVDEKVLKQGLSRCSSAVFVHTSRFCGGHGNLEATLAMARGALRL